MSAIAPVKLDKKQTKVINKVRDGLSEINNYGIPIDMLNLKFGRDASTAAQNILDNENSETKDLLAQITGSSITIPPVMSFRYWYMINFFGDIAVNRFKITCDDKKTRLIFKKLLKSAILYSDIAYESNENYGVVSVKSTNKLGEVNSVVIQPIPMKIDELTATNKAVSIKDITTATTPKKFAYFRWNELGVGLFCLMMSDLCLEIYKKMVIDNNASNLISLPSVRVSSIDNFITENKFNRNPFNGAKIQIVDTQSKADINNWEFEKENRGNMWLDELHADLRFHQEYYYGLFGFNIGSAKEQVLSADTKMSSSRAAALQQDLLERIELFAEEFSKLAGHTVKVELKEIDITPQNENADKDEPTTDTRSTIGSQLEKNGGSK